MPPRRHPSKQPPAAAVAAAAAVRKQARTTATHGEENDVLQVFVLDTEEQAETGTIGIYGCTRDRRSVMLTVEGFQYHFTLSAADGVFTATGLRSEVGAVVQL
jgi:hypothetical protein